MLLGSILLALLDERDYQLIMVWSADYFLDSELHVSGPLSVHYSDDVSLAADAIQLRAHDGSYLLERNASRLHFQPASVLSGALWIDELVLGDLFLKINQGDESPGGRFCNPAGGYRRCTGQ